MNEDISQMSDDEIDAEISRLSGDMGGGKLMSEMTDEELDRAIQEASGGSSYGQMRPAEPKKDYGSVTPGVRMDETDFADSEPMTGAEKSGVQIAAASGSDAYEGGGFLNGVGALGYNMGGARAADNWMYKNAQELASGVKKVNGQLKRFDDDDMDESEIDWTLDAMGANGVSGWLRKFLGGWASRNMVGDENLSQQWEREEGYKYKDPREHKRAKLSWAQDIARGVVGQREETKANAQEELKGRQTSTFADVVDDAITQGGYSAPYALPGLNAAPLILSTLARAGELTQDDLRVDKDGNIVIENEGDDMGRAFGKGFKGAAKEVAIERIGGKLGMKALGKVGGYTLGRIPLLRQVGSKVAATPVGVAYSKYMRLMNNVGRMTGVNSLPEEYLEELEDQLLESTMGTDSRDSELAGTTAGSRVMDDMFGKVNPETGEREGGFFGAENQKNLIRSLLVMQALQGGPAKIMDLYNGKYAGVEVRTDQAADTDHGKGVYGPHGVYARDGRNYKVITGIDDQLKDIGVPASELKYYTTEEKIRAYCAWVDNLDEAEVKGVLDDSVKYVNQLLDTVRQNAGSFNLEKADTNAPKFTMGDVVDATDRSGQAVKRYVDEASGITIDAREVGDGQLGFAITDGYGHEASARTKEGAEKAAAAMLKKYQVNNHKATVINDARERMAPGANIVTAGSLKEAIEKIEEAYGKSAADNLRNDEEFMRMVNGGNGEAFYEPSIDAMVVPMNSIKTQDDVLRLFTHEGTHGGWARMFNGGSGEESDFVDLMRRSGRWLNDQGKREDSHDFDWNRAVDEYMSYNSERLRGGASPLDRLIGNVRKWWRANMNEDLLLDGHEVVMMMDAMRKKYMAANEGGGGRMYGGRDSADRVDTRQRENLDRFQSAYNKAGEFNRRMGDTRQRAETLALPYKGQPIIVGPDGTAVTMDPQQIQNASKDNNLPFQREMTRKAGAMRQWAEAEAFRRHAQMAQIPYKIVTPQTMGSAFRHDQSDRDPSRTGHTPINPAMNWGATIMSNGAVQPHEGELKDGKSILEAMKNGSRGTGTIKEEVDAELDAIDQANYAKDAALWYEAKKQAGGNIREADAIFRGYRADDGRDAARARANQREEERSASEQMARESAFPEQTSEKPELPEPAPEAKPSAQPEVKSPVAPEEKAAPSEKETPAPGGETPVQGVRKAQPNVNRALKAIGDLRAKIGNVSFLNIRRDLINEESGKAIADAIAEYMAAMDAETAAMNADSVPQSEINRLREVASQKAKSMYNVLVGAKRAKSNRVTSAMGMQFGNSESSSKSIKPSSVPPKDFYKEYRYEVDAQARTSFGEEAYDRIADEYDKSPYPGGPIFVLAQNIGSTSHYTFGKIPSSKSLGEAVAEGWKKYGKESWDHQREIIESAFERDAKSAKPAATATPATPAAPAAPETPAPAPQAKATEEEPETPDAKKPEEQKPEEKKPEQNKEPEKPKSKKLVKPPKRKPAAKKEAKKLVKPPKAEEKKSHEPTTPVKPDGKGKNATEPIVTKEEGSEAIVEAPDSVEDKIAAMPYGRERSKEQAEYLTKEVDKAEDAIKGKWRETPKYKRKAGAGAYERVPEGVDENGKETFSEIPDTITVKVPGDGEFTVVNNPDGIARLRTVARRLNGQGGDGKLYPKLNLVEGVMGPRISSVSWVSESAISGSNPRSPAAPGKIAKPTSAAVAKKIVNDFVSTDTTRNKDLLKPIVEDGNVFASDGNVIFVIDSPDAKGPKSNVRFEPIFRQFKYAGGETVRIDVNDAYAKIVQTEFAVDIREDGRLPSCAIGIGNDGKFALFSNDGRLTDGEQTIDYASRNADGMNKVVDIKPENLRKVLAAAAKMGVKEVDLTMNRIGAMVEGDGFKAAMTAVKTDQNMEPFALKVKSSTGVPSKTASASAATSKRKAIGNTELQRELKKAISDLVNGVWGQSADASKSASDKIGELAHRAAESGMFFPKADTVKKLLDMADDGKLTPAQRKAVETTLNANSKWVEENRKDSDKGVRWSKSSDYMKHPSGAQKQANTSYPDASNDIRRMGDGGVRWSFADDAKALILKKRPDLGYESILSYEQRREIESSFSGEKYDDDGMATDEYKNYVNSAAGPVAAENAVSEIMKFPDSKSRKAALNWFIKGSILLPEDAPKVTEALEYANRAKGKANTDALSYPSPMAMIEALHEFKPKAKPINPDKVPELSDRREMGNGVVTYLVQDDRAGQQAMRQIINTHWGEDANPWCLLHGDGHGNLSDGYGAWHYWNHYNALPKRVAFKDGKLLAFMATDESRQFSNDVDFIDIDDIEYYRNVPYMSGTIDDFIEEWENLKAEGFSSKKDLNNLLNTRRYVDLRNAILENKDAPEQWWDRQDSSHDGIPLGNMPVPNDKFGRWADFEIVNGELEQIGGYKKNDGRYNSTEWYQNGLKKIDRGYDFALQWAEDGSLIQYDKDGKKASFKRKGNPLDTVWINEAVALRLDDGTLFDGNITKDEAERIYRENNQVQVPRDSASDKTVRWSTASSYRTLASIMADTAGLSQREQDARNNGTVISNDKSRRNGMRDWREERFVNASLGQKLADLVHDRNGARRVLGDFIRRKIQDYRLDLLRMEEMAGVTDKGQSAYYAFDSAFGKVEQSLADIEENLLNPLMEQIANNRLDEKWDGDSEGKLTKLDALLMSMHGPERNRMIAEATMNSPDGPTLDGSGRTTAEWNDVRARLDAEGFTAKAQAAIGIIQGIMSLNRGLMVSSGLMSQAQADEWERLSPNYVPLRDEDGQDSTFGQMMWKPEERGGGRSYGRRESPQAMGRKTLSDSPVVMALSMLERTVSRAADNEARQKLAEIVKNDARLGHVADETAGTGWQVPMRQIKTPNGFVASVPDVNSVEQKYGNVVAYKEDGVLKYIVLGNDASTDAAGEYNWLPVQTANRVGMAVKKQSLAESGPMVNFFRSLTRVFGILRTSASPTFLLSNGLADNGQAFRNIVSSHGLGVAKDFEKFVPKAMLAARKLSRGKRGLDVTKEMERYAREWADNGGRIGGMNISNFREMEDRAKSKLRKLERRMGHRGTTLKDAAEDAWNWVQDFGENLNAPVEMGTRLAVYAAMRKSGMSIEDAVSYSRDVTVNFNRKGEWTPIINALYAFSNASIQDLHRSGVAAVGRNGASMLFAMSVVGLVSAMLGYGQDDPEDEREGNAQWKNTKEYGKQNSVGFRLGGKTVGIPLRGLARIPYYIGHKAFEVLSGNASIADAAGKSIGFAVDNLIDPIGSAPTLGQTIAPSVIRPGVEIMENVKFSGQQMYRTPMNEQQVRSEMGRSSTGGVYRFIARQLNALTGGNAGARGLVDVQPEKIEALWNWIGGSLSRDVGQVVDTLSDLARFKAPNVRNVPFVSRMVRDLDVNSAKFHEAQARYDAAKKEFDAMETPYEMDRVAEDAPWLYRRNKAWNDELKDLKNMASKLLKEEMRIEDDAEREAVHKLRMKAQYLFIHRMETPPKQDSDGVVYEREARRKTVPFLKRRKREEKRRQKQAGRERNGLLP